MKRNLPVGIIQPALTTDVNANRRLLCDQARIAAAQGARLIVLPELHDTPYFCQVEDVDTFDLAAPAKCGANDIYSDLALELRCVLVTSRFERRANGLYHNTAYVYDTDGRLAGFYRKMHIPDDPGYYEKFYFTPGDADPGFRPIDTSAGKLGVLVCWDQWYPEAARIMALSGADLLIYPTAIGWDAADPREEQERQREAWTTVQRGHAVANGLPVITVNRTGYEAVPKGDGGIRFWGSSFVAGPQGELLHRAPVNEAQTAVVDIDLARSEHVRRWWPFLRDRRIDAYAPILKRYND